MNRFRTLRPTPLALSVAFAREPRVRPEVGISRTRPPSPHSKNGERKGRHSWWSPVRTPRFLPLRWPPTPASSPRWPPPPSPTAGPPTTLPDSRQPPVNPLVLLTPSIAAAVELPRRLAATGRAAASTFRPRDDYRSRLDLARAVAEPELLGRGLAAWTPATTRASPRACSPRTGRRPSPPRRTSARPGGRGTRADARGPAPGRRSAARALAALADRARDAPEDRTPLRALARLYRAFEASRQGQVADPGTSCAPRRALSARSLARGADVLSSRTSSSTSARRSSWPRWRARFPVRRPAPRRAAVAEPSSFRGLGPRARRAEVAWERRCCARPRRPARAGAPAPAEGLFEPPAGGGERRGRRARDRARRSGRGARPSRAGCCARRAAACPSRRWASCCPRPTATRRSSPTSSSGSAFPTGFIPRCRCASAALARSLLLLFRCRGLLRAAVMEFLTFAPFPLRDPGRRGQGPAPRWDQISRDASIVSELSRWIAGLHPRRARSGRQRRRRGRRARERRLGAPLTPRHSCAWSRRSTRTSTPSGRGPWTEWSERLMVATSGWRAPRAGPRMGGVLRRDRRPGRARPLDARARGARSSRCSRRASSGSACRSSPRERGRSRGRARRDGGPALPRGRHPRTRGGRLPRRLPAGSIPPRLGARSARRRVRAERAGSLAQQGCSRAHAARLFGPGDGQAPPHQPGPPARGPAALPRARSPGHGAAHPVLPPRRRARPDASGCRRSSSRRGRRPRGTAGGAARAQSSWSRTIRSRCRWRTRSTPASATGSACCASRGGGRRIAAGSAFFGSRAWRCLARWSGAHALRRLPRRSTSEERAPPRSRRPPRSPRASSPSSRAAASSICCSTCSGCPPARARGAPALEPLERGNLFHEVAERYLRERRDRGELPVQDSRRRRSGSPRWRRKRSDRLVAGNPPRFTRSVGAREAALPRHAREWLAREAAAADRSTPAHFEVSFGLPVEADHRAARPATRSRSTWATAAACGSRGRSTASTGAPTAPSCFATTRRARRPGTTAASSAEASSSRSPSTSWPWRGSSPASALRRPSSTTWTAAARSRSTPTRVSEVPEVPARAGGPGGQRHLRPGAHVLRLLRLQGVAARRASSSAAAASRSATPSCSGRCACGTWCELASGRPRGRARARAARPRHEPGAGGGGGHGQDDAARGPHRALVRIGHGPPRPRSRPSPSPRTRPPR